MSEFNVRRAAVQVELAAINSRMVGFLSIEVLASAIAFGCWKRSLAQGLIGFVVFTTMSLQRESQALLAGMFTLAWAIAAGFGVHAIDPSEPVAWFTAAFIAAVASTAIHFAAFQWQRDLA